MAITHRTAEFKRWLGEEREAAAIAELWQRWHDAMAKDMALKREIRDYIFATDTTTTTNNKLPWRNKTTIPKLCQLRDNFHANYMARLFPNDEWVVFEAEEKDAASIAKRRAMEAYMRTKLRDQDFETIGSRLVYDFIDYGNAFAGVEWVADVIEEDSDGTATAVYIGPRAYRISPEDIVFDITADSFDNSPIITRSIKSMGDFEKDLLKNPFLQYDPEKVEKLRETRKMLQGRIKGDKAFARWKGLSIDGFGSIEQYFNSGYIELLEFEGDWYDPETGELHTNVLITVADRCHVLRAIENPVWGGRKLKVHCGWRHRPDNLMAMGPLDNLVGMQYRIDHLENMKADAADMVLFPMLKVSGWVEDFEIGPGERINVGDEGDVSTLHLPADLVSAENQIGQYMQLMEELAGAPKEAMGFRTPGEKTKYEVQQLENAASRIFQSKIGNFERVFIEKIVNLQLILARQSFEGRESVSFVDPSYGAKEFMTVTKADLMSKGRFRAIGARHFESQATMIQNLNSFMNSALGQDPGIRAHMSNKKIAMAMEEWLGFEKYGLVGEYIGLQEQVEAATVAANLQAQAKPQPPMGPEEAAALVEQQQAIAGGRPA